MLGIGRGGVVQRRSESEQAALRRIATLVATDVEPRELFALVAEEVARVVDAPYVAVARYEPDDTATICGTFPPEGALYRMDSRLSLEGASVLARIRTHGEPARIDDYTHLAGEIARGARIDGLRSGVGVPITVAGHVWGAIVAWSRERLPEDFEARLGEFTELVATAIANAESGDARARLAAEQAALRRVATLVAEGAGPQGVFRAVAGEVGTLFGSDVSAIVRFAEDGKAIVLGDIGGPHESGKRVSLDPGYVVDQVRQTRRSARFDTDDPSAADMPSLVQAIGIRSAVASPIVVEGELWGAITVASVRGPLAPRAEGHLTEFTELVATAVSNSQARDVLAGLVEEQAALRRVATLVARDAPPSEVFAAVAMEVGTLLDTDITVVGRYDGDGSATAIGSWSAAPGGVPVGTRSAVGGHNVLTLVAETGLPARVEGYDEKASGEAAEIARRHGWRSSIAAPISVEDRVWGVMLVATVRPEPFPAGAEERLAAFTDLVATALSNAQAHDEVQRFGEEQAALGRVATLVAGGAAPEQVFTSVVDEASSLLGLERIELVRYDGDTGGTVVAASGQHPFPAGSTWSLDDPSVMATVARTAQAARIDDYNTLQGEIARNARAAGFQSAIGAPVTVEGRLWGAIIAISTDPVPIPERSETRLGQFTELVATAVANAESRDALARLADEQAALRRVATLVAEGVEPAAVFSAVGEEIGRLLGSSMSAVGRFEPGADGTTLVIVGVGGGDTIEAGSRWRPDDLLPVARVLSTERSVRIDEMDWSAGGPVAEVARQVGVVSIVASPIFVEGRLWGVMTACDTKRLPPEAEERLEKFSELIATAIANAETSAELAASRRRIVAAADEARRRIERDLHDGIQQRLIALNFRVRGMTRRPPEELPEIAAELSDDLKDVTDELREVSRGIHPAILTEAGLGPALRALARRSNVPIEAEVNVDRRLPADVEAAAYYIVSEALTNVERHARANVVHLGASSDDGALTLEVCDDGIGGVDAARGSGVLGLTDRVEALGGTISIASPPCGGTTLSARLPVAT
jgi:GAF domain-containing protein